MQIFRTDQVRELDTATIAQENISSLELMECAADSLYRYLSEYLPKNKRILVLAGPGNNGGDALAVARKMIESGYSGIKAILLSGGKKESPDCLTNAIRLKDLAGERFIDDKTSVFENSCLRSIGPSTQRISFDKDIAYDYIIEGLFGSGLNRSLEGFFAEVVTWINARKPHTEIISIDLPSGLFGEDNRKNHPEAVVKADLVLGIQFPRLAFLLPENTNYIKKWVLTPLKFSPQSLQQLQTPYSLIEASSLKAFIHSRQTFAHKGNFGHGLLIAGSYEMCGAAILAARAALRAGIGLLDVHTPPSVYDTVQGAVPEAMVQRDPLSEKYFASIDNIAFDKLTAIAIGPGLGCGKEQGKALDALLNELGKRAKDGKNIPAVLDADALNLISQQPGLISKAPPNSILTPHPKEFDRLVGMPSSCGYERLEKARQLAKAHQIFIVLKGAHTAIISPDGTVCFNTTGNPGMATGGSGDVLSGILLSLLAQGYTPSQTCLLGVYLHGLSGDIALENESVESLTAGDLIRYSGKAFLSLTK